MKHLTSIVAAAAIAITGTALAQQKKAPAKTLKVGDNAPAIKVGTWVKGKPVTKFEDGNVYVMEFWATWCGPCIRGIPHLTELQKEYKNKGVTVVGTAIWQREDTQAGRQSKVTGFVEGQGDKMNYTVAVDDDSSMSDSWMRPAGRNGIPSAFIVGKTGKIEWIGHPGQMDSALGQIVAGNYDMEKFAAAESQARAWTTDSRRANTALRSATREGDATKVMTIVNDLTQKHGNNPQAQQMKYRAMLQFAPSQGSVFAYGSAIAKKNWNDAQFLNSISWWTVDDSNAKYRNYEQATEWAARADELTHHKDAQVIDTYARCLWEQGHIDKAIALQREAVDLADPQMKSTIEKTLKDYLAEASQG